MFNRWDNPDASLYFPATGYRNEAAGNLTKVKQAGVFWQAVPDMGDAGRYFLLMSKDVIATHNEWKRSYAFSVYPVAEEHGIATNP